MPLVAKIGAPLAALFLVVVVKEYKLCRVKTIRVTVSMVKDRDQLIYVSVSVSPTVRFSISLSDNLR